MKTCFRCGHEKSLDEFYAHPEMKDGRLGKCKVCTREDRRKHERENPASVLVSRLKCCEKSPTARNAYHVVELALVTGDLIRPTVCSGCDCRQDEHRIEAHHHDYTQPLDVIWLCTPCHRRMDIQRQKRRSDELVPQGQS